MNSTIFFEHSPTYDTATLSGIYCFGFFLGVFGNAIVILATVKYKSLQIPTNAFLCNLCAIDVLTLVLGVPLFMVNKESESFLEVKCLIFEPTRAVLVMANVFTLVLIAIERNLVIIYPTKMAGTRSLKKSILTCMLVDLAAVVLGIPTHFIQKSDRLGKCVTLLELNWSIFYVIIAFVVQCITPLSIMFILYLQTWYKIRSLNRDSIKSFNKNRTPLLERKIKIESLDENLSCNREIYFENERRRSDTTDLRKTYNETMLKRRSRSFSGFHEITENSNINLSLTDLRESFESLNDSSDKTLSRIPKCSNESNKILNRKNSILINNETYKRLSSHRNHENHHQRGSNRNARSFTSKRISSDLTFQRKNSSGRMSNKYDYVFRSPVQRIRQSCTSILAGADLREITERFTLTRYKQTLKTLKIFGILLMFFFICMLPFHVVEILNVLKIPVSYRVSRLCKGLIYFHAFVNPWLYGGLTKHFQFAFKRLFSIEKQKSVKLGKGGFINHLNSLRTKTGKSGQSSSQIQMIFRRFLFYSRNPSTDNSKKYFYKNIYKSSLHRIDENTQLNNGNEINAVSICAPIIFVTNHDDDIL